jgi:hypothetical protein
MPAHGGATSRSPRSGGRAVRRAVTLRQVLWLAANGSLAVWVHAVTTGSVPQPRTYHSADAFNGADLRSRSPRRARRPATASCKPAPALHQRFLVLWGAVADVAHQVLE